MPEGCLLGWLADKTVKEQVQAFDDVPMTPEEKQRGMMEGDTFHEVACAVGECTVRMTFQRLMGKNYAATQYEPKACVRPETVSEL